MPWLRLYRDLPSHPKIIRLGRKLKARGSPEPEAVALASFILVLCTAASYATVDTSGAAADGALPVRSYDELDEIIGYLGMTEDMLSVRLLDETDDGRIYVHGFAERNRAVLEKLRRDHARDRANEKATGTPPARHRHATGTPPTRERDAGATIDGDGDRDGDGEDEDEPEMSKDGPSTVVEGRENEREGTQEPAEDSERIQLPSAPTDAVRALIERWNVLATELKLPRCAKLTAPLRAKLNARIKEDALLVRFDALAEALRSSKFYRGDNDRSWRANPTWLARPGLAAALIAQHEAAPKTGTQARAAMPAEALAAHHAEALRKQAEARKADDDERERIRREEAEQRARVLRLPQAQRDALKAEILKGWPPMLARAEPADGYSRSMIAEMARRSR